MNEDVDKVMMWPIWWLLQVGAFSVLKELVIVLPNSLSEHMGSLVPGIEKALNVSDDEWFQIWLCWVYALGCNPYNLLWCYRTRHQTPTWKLKPWSLLDWLWLPMHQWCFIHTSRYAMLKMMYDRSKLSQWNFWHFLSFCDANFVNSKCL